jgi:hypothetical protein
VTADSWQYVLCHARCSTGILAGILTKICVASGKHLCKTCASDVLLGVGMQNRAEIYTRERAIKINLFNIVLKRWALTSEIRLHVLVGSAHGHA